MLFKASYVSLGIKQDLEPGWDDAVRVVYKLTKKILHLNFSARDFSIPA